MVQIDITIQEGEVLVDDMLEIGNVFGGVITSVHP